MVSAASVLSPVAVQVLAVAAQVLALVGEPAFIVAEAAFVGAQLAAILADVAELVWIAIAGLVQPARALGHFIRAHSLQPVDPVGQLRATDTLLGPAADHLP